MLCKTIAIVHAKHGEAHCNEDQLEAMKAEGWKAADKKDDKKGDKDK
jgi:hypothetical protein